MARVQDFVRDKPLEVKVYLSPEYGICRVAGVIRTYHDLQGGADSWLGLPTADWDGSRQNFEGGSAYRSLSGHVTAVPSATIKLIMNRGLEKDLGPPLEDEQFIGADGPDKIQLFKNGVVLVREGKPEILLRA
jgi:hypothetical protein